MTLVIGGDLHAATCTFVGLDEQGNVAVKPARIKSTPDALTKFFRRHPDAVLVVEAGPCTEWVYDHLREAFPDLRIVVVVPPDHGDKKNDREDALRLARNHLAKNLKEVRVPPKEIRAIQRVVRARHFLVQERTRLVNKVKHEALRTGLRHRRPECKPGRLLAKEVRAVVVEALPHLAAVYGLIDKLEEEVRAATDEVERIGAGIPEVARLRSVRGFGPVVALSFYAEVWDVFRFERAEELVRYFGLDPRGSQSGDAVRDHHRISKRGRAYVRALLNQAAWAHVREGEGEPSSIARDYARMLARGKPKGVAITMVCRKLAKAAFHVLRENRDFTPQRPEPAPRPKAARAPATAPAGA